MSSSPGLEVKGNSPKLPFTSALTKARSYIQTFELSFWSSNHQTLITPITDVTKTFHQPANQPVKMGRAGYETTYVCNDKDSAAADAIQMHEVKRAEAADIAAIEAAEAAEAKLVRSKKSRGIMAARKAAKDQATAQAGTYESEGDSDKTTKP